MAALSYAQPTTLQQALALRANGAPAPIAGGTDIYPAIANGARYAALLDLSRVAEFARPIEKTDGGWRMSPHVTWTDIASADLPRQFAGLKAAAIEVGGRQIQNRGTVVGNLCNASPAADGTVALLAMDAAVQLASARNGARTAPLSAFVVGNRRTLCRDDELVVGVRAPDWGPRSAGAFSKLGARRYLVISIVMAGVVLSASADGRIDRAGVAVGACGPKAIRLPAVEEALLGLATDRPIPPDIAKGKTDALTPIDDVRGAAAYRAAMAPRMVADTAERARQLLAEAPP